MSTQHSKAAEAYLQKPRVAKHHDQTFYGVRQKRDRMAQDLPEWEDLREAASQIKKHTIGTPRQDLLRRATEARQHGPRTA